MKACIMIALLLVPRLSSAGLTGGQELSGNTTDKVCHGEDCATEFVQLRAQIKSIEEAEAETEVAVQNKEISKEESAARRDHDKVARSHSSREEVFKLSALELGHDAKNSKTFDRAKALNQVLGQYFKGTMTEELVQSHEGLSSMASRAPIQVAELSPGRFFVLNGNGRIEAMRMAFKDHDAISVRAKENFKHSPVTKQMLLQKIEKGKLNSGRKDVLNPWSPDCDSHHYDVTCESLPDSTDVYFDGYTGPPTHPPHDATHTEEEKGSRKTLPYDDGTDGLCGLECDRCKSRFECTEVSGGYCAIDFYECATLYNDWVCGGNKGIGGWVYMGCPTCEAVHGRERCKKFE